MSSVYSTQSLPKHQSINIPCIHTTYGNRCYMIKFFQFRSILEHVNEFYHWFDTVWDCLHLKISIFISHLSGNTYTLCMKLIDYYFPIVIYDIELKFFKVNIFSFLQVNLSRSRIATPKYHSIIQSSLQGIDITQGI